MDIETLEALARVVILASLYVDSIPQSGTANVEAIDRVTHWMDEATAEIDLDAPNMDAEYLKRLLNRGLRC